MKKILILTSRYLPNPSANGINTKYIVEELKQRGYDVTCISVKEGKEADFDIIDNTPIYRVTPSLYSRMLQKEATLKNTIFKRILFSGVHIFRKAILAFLLFKFPNFDLFQVDKIYKLVEKIHKQEKFDCVIGVFKPFSNVAALTKFKRKNPDVSCGAYYLDLINSSQKPSIMPNDLYKWLCYKGDVKVFKNLDFILMAKGGKSIYDSPQYNHIKDKLEYIDFPTFLKFKEIKMMYQENRDSLRSIKITYAGTLDRSYRNPEYILKSLEAASLIIGDIELNIYGKNNCEDILSSYSDRKNFKVVYHGFKPHDLILQAMLQSHFLLNISNKLQNAVPSKIFEIFSIGKPIVNLVFDEEDVTNEYFKRYPASINIRTWNDFEYQVDNLIKFIKTEYGNQYDKEQIKRDFIENTPEYTVNLIEERLFKTTGEKVISKNHV